MSLPSFEPGHFLQSEASPLPTTDLANDSLRVRLRNSFEYEYLEKRLRCSIRWNSLVLL